MQIHVFNEAEFSLRGYCRSFLIESTSNCRSLDSLRSLGMTREG